MVLVHFMLLISFAAFYLYHPNFLVVVVCRQFFFSFILSSSCYSLIWLYIDGKHLHCCAEWFIRKKTRKILCKIINIGHVPNFTKMSKNLSPHKQKMANSEKFRAQIQIHHKNNHRVKWMLILCHLEMFVHWERDEKKSWKVDSFAATQCSVNNRITLLVRPLAGFHIIKIYILNSKSGKQFI